MNTYLLAWNPKRWDWKDLAKESLLTSQGELVTGQWSCKNGHVQRGDRLFLVRLGSEPRGIMASGWAQGEVWLGNHWDERRPVEDNITYADYEFECILNPDIGALPLTNTLRKGALAKVHWSPQGSGTSIPLDAADELERLWENTRRTASFVSKAKC